MGLTLPAIPQTIAEDHLDELKKLIEAAGGEAVATVVQDRRAPDPATWIGRGKTEEVQQIVAREGAGLVVFDDDLSPAQVRNLEKVIQAKVVDRSGLILDIFARRARTREARTQVELAQLEYLLPRLTRQWTHLSRQAGGIGTRGVGETQLEIDRRIIRRRISKLRDELKKIERTRETQRQGRGTAFTVALVGYTNAGKSTLFNQLTGGSEKAANLLFATLDAKMQKFSAEMPQETVAIDTVGFVRKLPHHLVASFRSTMEEAVAADLVLHVVDHSHVRYQDQTEVGRAVLADLGIPRERILEVANKMDRFIGGPRPSRDGEAIPVSALTGEGIPALLDAIREREAGTGTIVRLSIPMEDSRTMARLYDVAQVRERTERDSRFEVTAWIPQEIAHQFEPFRALDGTERTGADTENVEL